MDYNLLNESWIPVLWKDGHSGRVGIVEALTEGHRIRQIAAANPMDRVAILRFLLALLYWCNRDAPYDKDSLSAFWFKKLKEKEECFDLLGKENSFYQDHAGAGKPVAATNLLHDLPSGSNIAHFRHLRDFRDGLCLACCAMGLLRWATVASAGTKGPYEQMTASINGNSPAYSIRMGATLLKTLCCNWPVSNPIEGDAPLWDGAWEESQLGLLKGMTWQSRRILLAPPDAGGNRDSPLGNVVIAASQRTAWSSQSFFGQVGNGPIKSRGGAIPISYGSLPNMAKERRRRMSRLGRGLMTLWRTTQIHGVMY